MDPEKPGVKQQFTVAVPDTEEQKRQQAIESIND